ncbi:MAG: hypothetical protein KH548_06415, partial [Bifidobacterium catenulatum]|nr:hypothetical protein [Bifidobacterium catenulatum]
SGGPSSQITIVVPHCETHFGCKAEVIQIHMAEGAVSICVKTGSSMAAQFKVLAWALQTETAVRLYMFDDIPRR